MVRVCPLAYSFLSRKSSSNDRHPENIDRLVKVSNNLRIPVTTRLQAWDFERVVRDAVAWTSRIQMGFSEFVDPKPVALIARYHRLERLIYAIFKRLHDTQFFLRGAAHEVKIAGMEYWFGDHFGEPGTGGRMPHPDLDALSMPPILQMEYHQIMGHLTFFVDQMTQIFARANNHGLREMTEEDFDAIMSEMARSAMTLFDEVYPQLDDAIDVLELLYKLREDLIVRTPHAVSHFAAMTTPCFSRDVDGTSKGPMMAVRFLGLFPLPYFSRSVARKSHLVI